METGTRDDRENNFDSRMDRKERQGREGERVAACQVKFVRLSGKRLLLQKT